MVEEKRNAVCQSKEVFLITQYVRSSYSEVKVSKTNRIMYELMFTKEMDMRLKSFTKHQKVDPYL